MARQKTEPTARYVAVDSNGREYKITVYTTYMESVLLSTGESQWHATTEAHKLANGNHVNVNNDGTLEDVHTGTVMRRK